MQKAKLVILCECANCNYRRRVHSEPIERQHKKMDFKFNEWYFLNDLKCDRKNMDGFKCGYSLRVVAVKVVPVQNKKRKRNSKIQE